MSGDEVKAATLRVTEELYDHLLLHPFFDVSIRRILNLSPDEDVTENGDYWEQMTALVDQALTAMVRLNLSGKKGH